MNAQRTESDSGRKDAPGEGAGSDGSLQNPAPSISVPSRASVMAVHETSRPSEPPDGPIKVKVVPIRGRPNFALRWRWPKGARGKEHQRTTRIPAMEKNRRAADREATELERELNLRIGPRTPWSAFCERYRQEHLSGLSDATAKAWRTTRRHLERGVRPVFLEQLDAAGISKFVAYLRHKPRGAPIEETSIASYLKGLLAALSWAQRIGILERAPQFKLPKRSHGKQSGMRGRPITRAEYERLLAAVDLVRPADGTRWTFYLRGLWLSGLRLAESVSLSWDPDTDFSIADIDAEVPCYRILAGGQKSHADQVLPIAPEFVELLRATPLPGRRGTVFGLGLSADAAGRIVSKIGRAAGIVVNEATGKCVTAHDLRRSFGNRWAKRLPVFELKELMRHRNIKTTEQFYIRFTARELGKSLWAKAPPDEGE